MQSCSFSNPKGDVCECSGNNIKLSECKRHSFRHVQTYGLGINRDEISDSHHLLICTLIPQISDVSYMQAIINIQ